MRRLVFLIALLALVLSSCSKQETASSSKPHATILLRDGTRVMGAVVASSTAEITVAGDDNISRTIPMSQVKSVEYDEPPPPPAAPQQPQSASTPPAPSAPPRASARPVQSDSTHENHYHPPQAVTGMRAAV